MGGAAHLTVDFMKNPKIPKEITEEEMRKFDQEHKICGFAQLEMERLREKKKRKK